MYRSRPKGIIDNDTLHFLSSLSSDKEIVRYDIIGSQAHSIMLYNIGIITKEELKKILSALEEIKDNPKLIESSKAEDLHEAIEEFVIERAGIDAGGKMHTARSRNDQVMLDVHMKIRDDLNEICLKIISLISSLIESAEKYKMTVMIMYTHLQQGQLGTFSHYLLSYSYSLSRDFERIYSSYDRINQSPLGACAIAGSSIKIDRQFTAKILGFQGVIKNTIDATSSRDTLLEIASLLSIFITSLSRFAEDFIIWSTSEFGYIELDDNYSSTSSAMPQKKNPDPLEIIRAKTSIVIGNTTSMFTIVKGLTSGYSRDLQEIKPLLWNNVSIVKDVVSIIDNILKTVTVNEEMMTEKAKNSYAISYDIAEQLVKSGIPFRLAHKVVGSLVKIAIRKGNVSLKQLEQNDIEDVLKIKGISISSQDLSNIMQMDPVQSLDLRLSEGSPNIYEQEKMIKDLKNTWEKHHKEITSRIRNVMEMYEDLDRSITTIIKS